MYHKLKFQYNVLFFSIICMITSNKNMSKCHVIVGKFNRDPFLLSIIINAITVNVVNIDKENKNISTFL